MSEQSNGPTGPQDPPSGPPTGPPSDSVQGSVPPGYPPAGEPSPHGPGPDAGPGPYAGQGPYAPGPAQPMPQWQPVTPRRPFRERTTKLWLALVVGLACLVVGLGVGIAIGHATGHDDRGPGRFERFPGGPGRHGFGQRDGGGPFGFRNRQQAPDGSAPDQQQSPQTQPTPTPSS